MGEIVHVQKAPFDLVLKAGAKGFVTDVLEGQISQKMLQRVERVPVQGQNRVDLSFCNFPCFTVFVGAQETQMPGKNSTTYVIIIPHFVCLKR